MRFVLAAACLAAVTACAKPATAPTGPSLVRIDANDFAFGLPDTIAAGLTELWLVNHGAEVHHAVLARVTEERPLAEVLEAIQQPSPPAWIRLVPGPNQAAPHDSSNATLILEAGRYVLFCFLPSPDGMSHVAKGMMREFRVVGSVPEDAALPSADIAITLKDYDYELSAPLTAGTHTIRVENAGPLTHEVGIERLVDGKTLADYMEWGATGMREPPPTRPVGGIIGPSAGGPAGTFTVTLEPGRYLLTCYVPDPSDGRPHVAHGMVKEIEVN